MESSFSRRMKAEYTTDALREYAKDVKSALAIPLENMPDAPLSIKRGKTHAEIGCQVGSVYAVKTEWGKALFIGHQQGNSRFYTEDDDIVPQVYIPEYNPSIETSCFPFYCSTKGMELIQKYSLEKIIDLFKASDNAKYGTMHPREFGLSLLGEGQEASVHAARLSPNLRIAIKSFYRLPPRYSLEEEGYGKKLKLHIFLKQGATYYGLFSPLNCFMVSRYLVKEILEPIPKKYCSFTGIEDFFATSEDFASAVGPQLRLDDLLVAYDVPTIALKHPYGQYFAQRFKDKTKMSKELLLKTLDELAIIRMILDISMTNYSSEEFGSTNILVKSYQNEILTLIPIDCVKRYVYFSATPIMRKEEVIRNFFVEHEQHKKEIYDKLVRHPFYEAYMRTHFIKEQAPDMFRDFGLAEVVKPVFV